MELVGSFVDEPLSEPAAPPWPPLVDVPEPDVPEPLPEVEEPLVPDVPDVPDEVPEVPLVPLLLVPEPLVPVPLVPLVPLAPEPVALEVSVAEPLVDPVVPVEPVVPLVVPESDWNGRPFDCEFASKLESRKGRPCGGFCVSNARPFGVELLDPTELPCPAPELVVEELPLVPDWSALLLVPDVPDVPEVPDVPDVPERLPELDLVELPLEPLPCPDCVLLLEPLAPRSEDDPLCCELL